MGENRLNDIKNKKEYQDIFLQCAEDHSLRKYAD